MNRSTLTMAALTSAAAFMLVACDRQPVVVVPPTPVAVPGPAGATGATGSTGATGDDARLILAHVLKRIAGAK